MAHMNLMGLAFYEMSTETTQRPLSDPETKEDWIMYNLILPGIVVAGSIAMLIIVFLQFDRVWHWLKGKMGIKQAVATDVESQCSDAEEPQAAPCSPREANEITRPYFDFAGIVIDCQRLDDEEYRFLIASLLAEHPPAYQREVLASDREDPPAYVR